MLQVLCDAMCVAIGDSFPLCICTLFHAVGLHVAIMVTVAVVIFVLQECGDEGSNVCDCYCGVGRFCDLGNGVFRFRDLEIVEHGCDFSLHDFFDRVSNMESVLLGRGIFLTVTACGVEELAEVCPSLVSLTSPLCTISVEQARCGDVVVGESC